MAREKDARLLGEKMPGGLEQSSSHSTPGAGSHIRLAVLSPGVRGPASFASCPDIQGPFLTTPSSVLPQVLPLGTFSVEMRGVCKPWLQGEEDFLGKLSREVATQRSRAEQPCGGSTTVQRTLVGLGGSGEGKKEHTAHHLPGQQRPRSAKSEEALKVRCLVTCVVWYVPV